MQKRFCDLKIGDKIYEIVGDYMFIDTIIRISIGKYYYDFSLKDQKSMGCFATIPLDYINESTHFNKDNGVLYTTDIKVFLNGL